MAVFVKKVFENILFQKSININKNAANSLAKGFLSNEYSPPKKKFNMIKLKKKNQKNREKLKNAIFSFHINEIR